MEMMVCGAQAHPEADNGEDNEGTVESGPLKATGGLASVGERWEMAGREGTWSPRDVGEGAGGSRHKRGEGGI